MKKTIRLTESDLVRLVKRIIKESKGITLDKDYYVGQKLYNDSSYFAIYKFSPKSNVYFDEESGILSIDAKRVIIDVNTLPNQGKDISSLKNLKYSGNFKFSYHVRDGRLSIFPDRGMDFIKNIGNINELRTYLKSLGLKRKPNQEIVTNYKNEILIFQKELDLFINAINELIKIRATSDVGVKMIQMSDDGVITPVGVNRNMATTDYYSKNLNEWLVTYLKALNEYKEWLNKILSNSFDANTQSYTIKENTNNKKLIGEDVNPKFQIFEKFIPIVKRFIKSCERYGKFDKKNRGELVKNIGWSETMYGVNDVERIIFGNRTYTGAETLLFYLEHSMEF